MKPQTKGLTIVYTGEGKGKTTAALGLALRAAGHKNKVLIIQFGKSLFSGEVEGIKRLSPYVKLIQGGKGFVGILNDRLSLAEHQKAAGKSYGILHKELVSGKWDLVIADEIVGAVSAHLLGLRDILKLIRDKPEPVDLCLTGHHAHPRIMEAADLVTEMTSIKHPFSKGSPAKVGIDY